MKKRKFNYKIIIPLIILNIISVVSIYAITKNLTGYSASSSSFVVKQMLGFIAGYIGIFIIMQLDLKKYYKFVDVIYFVLLGMLFIMITGIPVISDLFVATINGARGWWYVLPIGGGPTIQPVEFMKIAMIFKLATITESHLKSYDSDWGLIRRYIIYGGLPIVFVLLQPDLGGAMLLGFPWLIMFLLSLKNKRLLKFFLLAITTFLILIVVLLIMDSGREFLVNNTPIQAYQLERITSWLKPFDSDKGLQLQQALILMGSAGPLGHGFGFTEISIPEPHTDMIYAMIVGMFGWLTGVGIIGIYYIFISEFINISIRSYDLVYKFMAIGFAGLFIIQIVENIGMIVGILPITGIVLPFLSAGVSALITYSGILGIVLNIGKNS